MADDMILLDGVRYLRYEPESESEFEGLIVKNAARIFGKDAIYLDIKKLIRTEWGKGTIPDGYLFYPEEKRFVLVEVELSSHDVYSHIAKQLGTFIGSFKNYKSRQKLASILREYISNDPNLNERLKKIIKGKGLFDFLLNEVMEPLFDSARFESIVVIERETSDVLGSMKLLSPSPKVLEVALYAREGAESEKAMRFVPQYEIEQRITPIFNKPKIIKKKTNDEKPLLPKKIKRGSVDYQSFYTELARRFPPNEQIKKINVPNNKRFYQSIFFGLSRVHYEWSFHNNPPTLFAVELHFEKSQKEANLKFIEIMEEHLSEIEKELDEKIIVQKDWGKKWAKLYIEKPITTIDESLKVWAIEKMVALINATYPILKNQKAKGKLSL